MQRQIGRQSDVNITHNPKVSHSPGIAEQIKSILYLCLSNWYWFVISLIITVGYAYYYLKKTVPVYERTTSILIKSEDKTSDNATLVDLGLVQINTNLTNEIMTMKTGALAQEIVRRLNLDVEYKRSGTFHDEVLYGIELPVEIKFLDIEDNSTAAFNLDLNKSNVELTNFVFNEKEIPGSWKTEVGDTLTTPAGKVVVMSTPSYTKNADWNVEVVRSGINSVAGSVQARINPYLRNQSASIINISYRDVSPARAEDVLNTLVAVYNENWVRERNQKTVNTNQFIKERLAYIENELGEVEQSISNWKSRNLILDVDATGGLAQSRAIAAEDMNQELENQIYMNKYIRGYLNDSQQSGQLLPANLGMTNTSIEGQIGEYNSLLLKRNNHLANSSLQNPLVRDLDEQLTAMRGSLIQSLDYELAVLQTQQNQVRSQYNQAIGKVASNPQQAQQLLSVERQQKVKEQLYLFLLQKREENELSQAFAAYNSQLIEPPHGSWDPVEPVKNSVMMMAIIIGLVVPGGIIALNEIMNTKVRGRKDLENLQVPFVGEIPQAGKKKRKLSQKKRNDDLPVVLVREKNRDMINEAFRVIRTNLEFMLGFDTDHHIVMLTSIDPGSGKTFITANLSTALAIKQKRVLVIDFDLRKGSFSKYVGSPNIGVSNFLNGQQQDYKSLIVKMGDVGVLPAGTLPPNPSELLFSSRFKEMLQEVRKDYDYVFLDCPPVEVVADAAIINRYADITLFVIRTGVMERSLLDEVETWYEEKRYNNLAVILNGTQHKSGYGYQKYGYHSYGYGYGYQYGK